jgi:hypothetical protein
MYYVICQLHSCSVYTKLTFLSYELGSDAFISHMVATAMAKYSHNTGINKIKVLVFSSDSEEFKYQ